MIKKSIGIHRFQHPQTGQRCYVELLMDEDGNIEGGTCECRGKVLKMVECNVCGQVQPGGYCSKAWTCGGCPTRRHLLAKRVQEKT